jgi:hypothetical protein
VRFVDAGGEHTCAELRSLGVRSAAGRVIALTEDHCIPAGDWCRAILRAHEAPAEAIGGTVDKEGRDTAMAWALYLSDYVRYRPPMPEGPAGNLTDCNVSYKRAALERIASVWEREFHEDRVHGAIRERGGSLWLSPAIQVRQSRRLDFGVTRSTGWPASRRLLLVACACLLPALLLGRIAAQTFGKGRCRAEFLRTLPALVVAALAWSWGEFLGYATGQTEATLRAKAPGGPAMSRSLGKIP